MKMIIKANGEREVFKPNKLRRSLCRSGASREVAEDIVAQIQKTIKNNESTGEIYKKAFRLLKQKGKDVELARYSLKQAIFDLGPSGYPFEFFVGRLFEF